MCKGSVALEHCTFEELTGDQYGRRIAGKGGRKARPTGPHRKVGLQTESSGKQTRRRAPIGLFKEEETRLHYQVFGWSGRLAGVPHADVGSWAGGWVGVYVDFFALERRKAISSALDTLSLGPPLRQKPERHEVSSRASVVPGESGTVSTRVSSVCDSTKSQDSCRQIERPSRWPRPKA